MLHTPEPDMHWLSEFVIGLIGGTMSIYSFIGWVPVSFGWLSSGTAFAVCGVLGALLGGCLAAETIREKRQKMAEMVPLERFELPTLALQKRSSTPELQRHLPNNTNHF
jgi:ABC-type Co2+ transport system permease subunit